MEQQTLKAIREAEQAAEAIEQKAAEEALTIVDNARKDAARLLEETKSAETAALQQQVERAKQDGSQLQQRALEEIAQDVSQLKADAAQKNAQARRLILDSLL